MDALRHVRLMADYNRWMNRRLFESAALLPLPELIVDRGAFFCSILGTLNHLAIGDALWLRRFSAPGHWDRLREADAWLPSPQDLRERLSDDLAALGGWRERLDGLIVDWCAEIKFNDLDRLIEYRNMRGDLRQQQVGPLMFHFFNHQTHHRGQVTTLLFQAGVDPGVTDLVALPGFDPFSASVGDATDGAPAATTGDSPPVSTSEP